MKIFFHASIYGKRFHGESYEEIVTMVTKLGATVYSDHLLKRSSEDTDKFTREDHQRDFQVLTQQIKQSDAVIIEATYPSIGTGHYMTIALHHLKPVLVLYQENPHGVLVGDPNRLLVLKKYTPSDDNKLHDTIKKFLATAAKKKLKNRFNIMLNDETTQYLDQEARKRNVSKADVIRTLIQKDIEDNA